MNATELRIGNYVNRKYWNPHPVTPSWENAACMIKAIGIHTFHVAIKDGAIIKFKHEDITPIPITPFLLERCGFIQQYKEHPQSFWSFKDQITIFNKSYVMQWRDGKFSFVLQFWGHGMSFKCEYVHQLQNIHYLSTGKELVVNIY